jgi:hypothetical protein
LEGKLNFEAMPSSRLSGAIPSAYLTEKVTSVGGVYLSVESIGTQSTTSQPTITSAQTAPAIILSVSFVV